MKIEHLNIDGPALLTPERHYDSRGYFSEAFRSDAFDRFFPGQQFVQDNHCHSMRRATLRGLHRQVAPSEQGKLVMVIRGAILDIAVDVRPHSPTFGHHVQAQLSVDNGQLLWIPPGFLHGYCTLADQTDVFYKVTAYYSPRNERTVAWNDPHIAIEWPFPEAELVISERDRTAPTLAQSADFS